MFSTQTKGIGSGRSDSDHGISERAQLPANILCNDDLVVYNKYFRVHNLTFLPVRA